MTCRRCGFTLTDLLVCLGVVFFLLVLFIPPVNTGRVRGRRNICNFSLHCLGLAMQTYVASGRPYPGFLAPLMLKPPVQLTNGQQIDEVRVSWLVTLLPYLEEEQLLKHWKMGYSFKLHPEYRDFTDPIANGYVSLLICPSAPPPPKSLLAPCTYIANTGRQDVAAFAGAEGQPAYPADWRANGVFFNQFVDGIENPPGAPIESITQDFISSHDGTSYTVMLSETTAAASYADLPPTATEFEASLGFVWWPPLGNGPTLSPPFQWHRINGPTGPAAIDNARPSSNHPGGVNVLMCDGHSRFISDQIDYGVWCLILTPDGQHCNDPGQVELVQPSSSNNYLYLRTRLVDDLSSP